MAYGTTGGDTTQDDIEIYVNPIIQVGLTATSEDNFYFVENPEEQYIGKYHIHQDGEIMIGVGELGITHDMTPSEIIFQKVTYEAINETREKISDLFYKLWFKENTLTDDQVLSLQTTIRGGFKQSGRDNDEPLVFFKKERNTLEGKKNLQSNAFDEICQYIFVNDIIDLEGKFSITQTDLPEEGTPPQEVTQYKMIFDGGRYEVDIARKVGDTFTDILNLSQLTKPKTSKKINAEKAREVLDTNIFELLPNQPNRQEQINNFFGEFDNLVGPTPVFTDANGDGAAEQPENYEVDEQSRISFKNKINASITRLDSQANEDNGDKTLESMRNKLNTYLGDVDNVIQDLPDTRPEYENISNGFLKIRKPNQAIIIKGQSNNLLEFQKLDDAGTPSYLSDGFTITMWVRFVDKQSSGTLFNFGNPLEDGGSGFRLETNVNLDTSGEYRRTIRLVLKDENNLLRDNHWGSSNKQRIFSSTSSTGLKNNYSPLTRYPNHYHTMYPEIPTDNLDEWYFICATYNPEIREPISTSADSVRLNSKDYWLNHRIKFNTPTIAATSDYWINIGDVSEGDIVANSFEGAKCKVEIISRTDLLKARGYKVGDISVTAPPVDGEDTSLQDDDGDNGIVVGGSGEIEMTNPSNQQSSEEETQEEETSDVEPNPTIAPNGFNPMTNPMTGTLSPQGQWSWNGISITWVAVEIEEESSEPIATNTPDDIINFGAGGGNY